MKMLSVIQSASVAGMTFCGYHYHPQIKTIIDHDSIKTIKDSLLDFKGTRYITEDTFCKIVGSLTGCMIGGLFYPFGIPYTLYFIDKRYSHEINSSGGLKKFIYSSEYWESIKKYLESVKKS